jgi:hypothetical protein
MIQNRFFIFEMCYILMFSLHIFIVSIFKIRFEQKTLRKKDILVWSGTTVLTCESRFRDLSIQTLNYVHTVY